MKSIAQPISIAAVGGPGHGGDSSRERTISARLSNTGSHSDGGDVRVKNSRSRSFYFGHSTVTVSQIHGMIDNIILPMAWTVSLGKRPCQSPVMTT
jgi:hypothetical protein